MNEATRATFPTRDGTRTVAVVYGDPLWCVLDECRVRFVRFVDGTSVEVMSNAEGKILPDYRHPSQLFAY